jgi:hypothetical protein
VRQRLKLLRSSSPFLGGVCLEKRLCSGGPHFAASTPSGWLNVRRALAPSKKKSSPTSPSFFCYTRSLFTAKSTAIMARRRTKKRTHLGARGGNQPNTGKSIDRSPKSMVIRIGAGDVGPSISQLVKDMRLVMEPGTASKLKERKNNKLRDFTTMCGPLGVTHLLLFSRSESGNTNLRMAVTPRGPTLHFRVDNYSLCKDIMRSQKRPKNSKDLFVTAPLVCSSAFSS